MLKKIFTNILNEAIEFQIYLNIVQPKLINYKINFTFRILHFSLLISKFIFHFIEIKALLIRNIKRLRE